MQSAKIEKKNSEQNYTNLQTSSHWETPGGQITLLRVIPTMTCQNATLTSTSLYICPGRVVIRFYVSFISFSSFLPPLPALLVASFTVTKCEGGAYLQIVQWHCCIVNLTPHMCQCPCKEPRPEASSSPLAVSILTFFLTVLLILFLIYLLTFILTIFLTFFLTYLLDSLTSDILPDILSGTASDILSGTSSDICSDNLSDFPSDILSDIFSAVLSDIYLLTFFLTFVPTYLLWDDGGWGPAANTGRGWLRLRSG